MNRSGLFRWYWLNDPTWLKFYLPGKPTRLTLILATIAATCLYMIWSEVEPQLLFYVILDLLILSGIISFVTRILREAGHLISSYLENKEVKPERYSLSRDVRRPIL